MATVRKISEIRCYTVTLCPKSDTTVTPTERLQFADYVSYVWGMQNLHCTSASTWSAMVRRASLWLEKPSSLYNGHQNGPAWTPFTGSFLVHSSCLLKSRNLGFAGGSWWVRGSADPHPMVIPLISQNLLLGTVYMHPQHNTIYGPAAHAFWVHLRHLSEQ